jgi:hypothetical protein
MTIREIANEINIRAKKHPFGKFQEMRKDIKGLSKKAGSLIFTDQTISDDGWAFHYGGRKEIQFNIGIEDEGLRYGLAFSLETSRSLPDLSILYPKILKLNSLIRNERNLFVDYKMWYWKGKRSKISKVFEIDESLSQNGTFIFLGKLMDIDNINYDEILSTFSGLLNIYKEIETEPNTQTKKKVNKTEFRFDNKTKNLPTKSRYNTIEKEINVDVRHSILQEKLYNKLVLKYGKNNVGLENQINGNRIDIVVKIRQNEYFFYEVKTGSSAKSCIRQAIGQLFEYAYWNNNSGFKVEMVVAGEFEIDKTTSDYIQYLKNEFKIPISYIKIE